jgi:hypothetical protein
VGSPTIADDRLGPDNPSTNAPLNRVVTAPRGQQHGQASPRQGGFTLTAVVAHAVLGSGAFFALLFAHVFILGGRPSAWLSLAAWVWGMIFAAHLGATISPRRLLGAHIGIFLVLSVGLIEQDLTDGGGVWSPWIVMAAGVTVLVNAGINFGRRPPDVLRDALLAPPANQIPPPIEQAAPGVASHLAPAEMSLSMMIANVGLGAFALISALGAVWVGVSDTNGTNNIPGSATDPIWMTISVEPFDSVDVAGNAAVIVRRGATPHVIVTGDSNLVPMVEAQVIHRQLRLSVPAEPGQARLTGAPLQYEIIAPNVAELRLRDQTSTTVEMTPSMRTLTIVAEGSAAVAVVEATASEVVVTAQGDSLVTLTGSVTDFDVTATDRARVEALDLRAQDVHVDVSQSASASVLATETLAGRVTGDGSVYYAPYGDGPLVDVETVGNALLSAS